MLEEAEVVAVVEEAVMGCWPSRQRSLARSVGPRMRREVELKEGVGVESSWRDIEVEEEGAGSPTAPQSDVDDDDSVRLASAQGILVLLVTANAAAGMGSSASSERA